MVRKIIFSLGLAKELTRLGHKIVEVDEHKYKKNRIIFIFEVNDSFYDDLKRIKNK